VNEATSQEQLALPAPAEEAPLIVDPVRFQRRLTVATLSLLLFVLAIYVLREFAVILQPLFIAVFLLYLILPAHRWLVEHRVRSEAAYGLILVLGLVVLYGVGRMVYASGEQLWEKWPEYEEKLDVLLLDVQSTIPFVPADLKRQRTRDLLQVSSLQDILAPLGTVVGTFVGFFAGLAVVSIYLVFLVAEKLSFPERLEQALGKPRADHVLEILESINRAIARYLVVKAFINLLAALLTAALLAAFGVPFVATWGILTFLFKFIPYLGSVVVVGAPLLVCLLEYSDRLWVVFVVAVLLVAIHQVLGNYVEPKLMGHRLGVSPLLILLSLTFWGLVWGIVGMILAIPLLMVFKIVLDNIPETKPVATLMSSE
jgi:AI-2 transport protein TqsA